MILKKTTILLVVAFIFGAAVLAGCDTTADRELRRADKALGEALAVNADAYAFEDYNAAEQLFQEAQELADQQRIQEARQAAIKAKLRAEDAKRKADERHRILESEMEKLGR